MGKYGNGIYVSDGNGNGMGMGMKSLKWEGIGTKNLFPHTSSVCVCVLSYDARRTAQRQLCQIPASQLATPRAQRRRPAALVFRLQPSWRKSNGVSATMTLNARVVG